MEEEENEEERTQQGSEAIGKKKSKLIQKNMNKHEKHS